MYTIVKILLLVDTDIIVVVVELAVLSTVQAATLSHSAAVHVVCSPAHLCLSPSCTHPARSMLNTLTDIVFLSFQPLSLSYSPFFAQSLVLSFHNNIQVCII